MLVLFYLLNLPVYGQALYWTSILCSIAPDILSQIEYIPSANVTCFKTATTIDHMAVTCHILHTLGYLPCTRSFEIPFFSGQISEESG